MDKNKLDDILISIGKSNFVKYYDKLKSNEVFEIEDHQQSSISTVRSKGKTIFKTGM